MNTIHQKAIILTGCIYWKIQNMMLHIPKYSISIKWLELREQMQQQSVWIDGIIYSAGPQAQN